MNWKAFSLVAFLLAIFTTAQAKGHGHSSSHGKNNGRRASLKPSYKQVTPKNGHATTVHQTTGGHYTKLQTPKGSNAKH